MKKSIIFRLLALCLALAVILPTTVLADEEPAVSGTCGDDLTWEYSDGALYITGSGAMYDFSDGSAPWNSFRDAITSVVMSGVTTVGACAFKDYDSISYVDFGSCLVEVGTQAFMNCDGLGSISLPETFRAFGEESFRGCAGLKEIHLSGGFPTFRMSCLWGDELTLYYPAGSIWDVEDIAWLEDVFDMEFIRADGYDPYDPSSLETTAETTVETTAETTGATTAPTTVPTTAPTTAPTTVPTTAPAADPKPDAPSTGSPGTQPTAAAPAEDSSSGSSGRVTVGVICAVVFVGCVTALLIIIPKSAKKGRYSRRHRR